MLINNSCSLLTYFWWNDINETKELASNRFYSIKLPFMSYSKKWYENKYRPIPVQSEQNK